MTVLFLASVILLFISIGQPGLLYLFSIFTHACRKDTFVFDEEGIKSKGQGYEGKHSWSLVQRMELGRKPDCCLGGILGVVDFFRLTRTSFKCQIASLGTA
jgi:hypothetical protein